MSEFDKEAERRRLREKYESEEEDRETTERMSQLLLQGATMTNQHCDACGSPIFRYQGQQFCPTCQAEAQEAAQASEAASNAAAEPADGAQQATPQDATQPDEAMESQPAASEQPESVPSQAAAPQSETPASGSSAGSGGLEAAGDSLASTIATLAARAEQTDDPRRAKEFLEAAREAADALAALPR